MDGRFNRMCADVRRVLCTADCLGERMNMVERVARAICRQKYGYEITPGRQTLNEARAAIEAMKDPTTFMHVTAEDYTDHLAHAMLHLVDDPLKAPTPSAIAVNVWKLMIDAALEDSDD